MPIDPFAPGAPQIVNTIPPDVYGIMYLDSISPMVTAGIYALAAIAVALIYRSLYK